MAIPTPAQFEALRVDGNADVCEVLQKYVAMINLMADLSAGMFNEDGTLSQEFTNLICATGCGGGGTATSTTGSASSVSTYFASRFLGGGGVFKGRLFYMTIPGFTYSTINGDMEEVIYGMAVRPSDGVVFVIYSNETADPSPYPLRLGTVNVSTGAITPIDIINFGGTDWTSIGPTDNYSLEFSSTGTLYLSSWTSGASFNSRIYTVNLTTAELTGLGVSVEMDSAGVYFYVFSMAFDPSGTMYGLGFNPNTNEYQICSINLTPNPAFGNALLATTQCAMTPAGGVPAPGATLFQGLICKSGKKYVWVRSTGDIYQEVVGTTCSSAAVFLAPSSMSDITAVAGVPS